MLSSYDGVPQRAPRPTLSTGARSTTSRVATIVLTAALSISGLLGVAPHASASDGSASTTATASTTSATSATSASSRQARHASAARRFDTKANRVLRVTRHQRGDRYQYGAAGPNRFDCSGLVMYVFQHALGKSLPHNAEMQYRRAHHISRAHLRRGDLVFQVDRSGYAYHVGIYAGRGFMWDAPHTGARVHKHRMYHTRWRFGRLIHWS